MLASSFGTNPCMLFGCRRLFGRSRRRTRAPQNWLHARLDSLPTPHDQQHTENVRQQRSPVALNVQAVDCLLCPTVFPQPVRFASETRRRREAFSSVCSHRTPRVSSLQSESPSARTPSPYGIHRKTAAFSISRIDTNRQCLDLLRQCTVSVAQSPASPASDSSFMHWLGVKDAVSRDH